MSEESNGSIISLFPKVPGGETKRIVVLDGRIQVAGQSLKIGLRRLQLCGLGTGSTRTGEGSSRRSGGKENAELEDRRQWQRRQRGGGVCGAAARKGATKATPRWLVSTRRLGGGGGE